MSALRRLPPLAAIATVLTVQLGGCAGPEDPYRRADVWKPEGAPIGNLAAMLADPHDLVRGRPAQDANVKQGGDAVTRLYRNEIRPLPRAAAAPTAAPAPGANGAAPPPAQGGI